AAISGGPYAQRKQELDLRRSRCHRRDCRCFGFRPARERGDKVMSNQTPGVRELLPIVVESRFTEAPDDGRNVDSGIGTLSGEAASQVTLPTKKVIALHSQAFPYVPTRQPWDSPTYY